VLARRGALYFLELRNADLQQPDKVTDPLSHDHDSARAPEPVPSGTCDAVLVRGFRRRYEGDTLVIDTVGVKIATFA